jgi:hypothetical protein
MDEARERAGTFFDQELGDKAKRQRDEGHNFFTVKT